MDKASTFVRLEIPHKIGACIVNCDYPQFKEAEASLVFVSCGPSRAVGHAGAFFLEFMQALDWARHNVGACI